MTMMILTEMERTEKRTKREQRKRGKGGKRNREKGEKRNRKRRNRRKRRKKKIEILRVMMTMILTKIRILTAKQPAILLIPHDLTRILATQGRIQVRPQERRTPRLPAPSTAVPLRRRLERRTPCVSEDHAYLYKHCAYSLYLSQLI